MARASLDTAAIEDFARNICVREGLIDVSVGGHAFQSSYSEWSTAMDPLNAITPHSREFGFHTQEEDTPWWLLDLRGISKLKYIIVQNRNNRNFYNRAININVSISINGKIFEDVFSGEREFGCSPKGNPLIAVFNNYKRARFIKIWLRGKGILHLSRVHALSECDVKRVNSSVYLANKNDGFGERARAMLNASVLAEHFGGKFQLRWPPLDRVSLNNAQYHAVSGLRETFSESYISQHVALTKVNEVNSRIGDFAIDYSNLSDFNDNKNIIVYQNAIQRLPQPIKRTIDPSAFRRAFDRIGFSPALEDARSAAYAVPIETDTIAIHVRSGDLILGTWRFAGQLDQKLIPLPVVIDIVRRANKNKSSIYLFGQEENILEYISSIAPSLAASKIRPSHLTSPDQIALFDIILMSRCSEIYAGSSGFAGVARMIGRAKHLSISRLFREEERFFLIKTFVDNYIFDNRVDPLHISFLSWLIYKSRKQLPNRADRLSYLDRSISIDAQNPLYQLVRAVEYYSDRMDEAGDAAVTLAANISRAVSFDLLSLLSRQARDVEGEAFVAATSAAAGRGSKVAAACMAMIYQADGRVTEARLAARSAINGGQVPFAEMLRRIADA